MGNPDNSKLMTDNQPRILLGLTTTYGSNWRRSMREIDELHISEIALFPTCLKATERKEYFLELEKTSLKLVPFTHVRTDMSREEIDLIRNKYNCHIFNIHSDATTDDFLSKVEDIRDEFFVENGENYQIDDYFWQIAGNVGGLCVDFAHWHDYGILRNDPNYQSFGDKILNYKIGCCHLSAIQSKPTIGSNLKGEMEPFHSAHMLKGLEEMNYLKDYKKYFPEVCAIELGNSLTEQLKVKEYIEQQVLGLSSQT